MRKFIMLMVAIAGLISTLQAQDTLVLKSGLSITGQVIRIDTDSVFLAQPSSGKTFGLPMTEVKEINLFQAQKVNVSSDENQRKSRFGSAQRDSLPHYNRIIKTSLFGPVFGQYFISREAEIKNNFQHTSWDMTLGCIVVPEGSPVNIAAFESDVYGGFLRLGLRQYLPVNPSQINPGLTQRLMGYYFGLQTTLTAYQYRESYSDYVYNGYYSYSTRGSVYIHMFKVALEFTTGLQLPLSHRLAMNLNWGVGLGVYAKSQSNDHSIDNRSYQFSNWNPGFFSMSCSVSFGYRFGGK